MLSAEVCKHSELNDRKTAHHYATQLEIVATPSLIRTMGRSRNTALARVFLLSEVLAARQHSGVCLPLLLRINLRGQRQQGRFHALCQLVV